uniref:SH3 domain-containing protein n=1 Tax=Arion vulgaris TaxID=1028688 RepID=A0A0B7AGD8_9EUPU
MVLTSALVFFFFRDFVISILDWSDHIYKRRMAKEEAKKCMDRLFQQQEEIEGASFGRGKSAVLEALAVHFSKVKDIVQVKGKVDDLTRSEALDEKSLEEFSAIYDSVKAVSDSRNSCLEVINHIASLEDHVQNIAVEFDARSVFLVNSSTVAQNTGEPNQANESVARTVQACISSVRENWKWVFQLLQCAEVHLRNAAAYQEFFQEAAIAEEWMNTTLSRSQTLFEKSNDKLSSSHGDAILKEIQDLLEAFLKWQTKVDYLFDKARQVVPVHLRLKHLPTARPVIALADFKTKEIEFLEGETLTLLDNSDRKKWKVQTETGQIGHVPAVIILITAPATETLDLAFRLRLQLLALWTSSLKTLGYKLIYFLLLVFRDWTDEEVKLLRAMPTSDKKEILRVLRLILEFFIKNWSDYGDFQLLQKRIARLETILEEGEDSSNEGKNENNSLSEILLGQVKLIEILITNYKEFWTFWEMFKSVVEMLKQPKFLLVCDKWEQLKFVTSANFVKFWDTTLHLDFNSCEPPTDTLPDISIEPTIVSTEAIDVCSEVNIQENSEQTSTDTVTSTLEEEQHTFFIKGVLDPRDNNTQLSLAEAIELGIVDESQKHYTNPNTGKVMSMSDAMNEGRVMVEFISKKKIREENNSYGLMTVTITKELRPYTIISVVDPVTEEKLTVAQAVTNKILDSASTKYRTEKGEQIYIVDAIQSGLVQVEYHGKESEQKKEVVTKTYLVYGVVDQKKKQKVSFTDAIQDGLLDRDTGEYINNVTMNRVGVQDAIMKGFIKARIVTDPSKLEINPSNMIVVEKLSNAKSKLLKSVKATKAFKA